MTIRLAILLILILATPCLALRGGPRLMMVSQPVDVSGNVNGSVSLVGIGGAGAQGALGLTAMEIAVLTVFGEGGSGGHGIIGINAGGNGTTAFSGIGGAGSIGSLTISGQILASSAVVGQGGSGVQGAPSVAALQLAVLTVSGQGGSGAIGSINIAAGSISNASSSITGKGSAGAPGSITVSALQLAAANLTGHGGSGSYGTVSVAALQMAVLTLSGQGGSGGIASALTTQQNTVIFPSGQGGSGAQGTASVAALQMAVLTVSGQGGSGSAGTVTAASALNGSASLTGRGGAGAGGTVTATGGSATSTIAYGSYATASNTSSTDLVISKPTSTAEGDLLVVAVIDDSSADLTATGWTVIQEIESSSSRTTVAYKVAGASEGTSYTFASTSSYKSGIITRFTKSGGTWDIEASSELAGDGNITSTAVTATDNSVLIIGFGSDDAANITSAPADMTEVAIVLPGSAAVGMWYEARSAGSVQKSISVEGTSNNNAIIAVVIDLVP